MQQSAESSNVVLLYSVPSMSLIPVHEIHPHNIMVTYFYFQPRDWNPAGSSSNPGFWNKLPIASRIKWRRWPATDYCSCVTFGSYTWNPFQSQYRHRRIADEYCGGAGAAVTKFPTDSLKISDFSNSLHGGAAASPAIRLWIFNSFFSISVSCKLQIASGRSWYIMYGL